MVHKNPFPLDNVNVAEVVPARSDRILVIEDDRAAQRVLRRMFELEGFTVDIADNGVAGLELFRAVAPSILLDLSLPGMPGQDAWQTTHA